MRRYVIAAALLFALVAIGYAEMVKLTFPGITYPDGREGTIQVAVKTSGNGNQVTACSYFSDPNEQYLGQYQANTTFNPIIADDVKQFCLDHFSERQSAQ